MRQSAAGLKLKLIPTRGCRYECRRWHRVADAGWAESTSTRLDCRHERDAGARWLVRAATGKFEQEPERRRRWIRRQREPRPRGAGRGRAAGHADLDGAAGDAVPAEEVGLGILSLKVKGEERAGVSERCRFKTVRNGAAAEADGQAGGGAGCGVGNRVTGHAHAGAHRVREDEREQGGGEQQRGHGGVRTRLWASARLG